MKVLNLKALKKKVNSSESSILKDLSHRVPRHIWGHGYVKVGDTDLKRQFQVSWCEIINYIYSIITII